MSKAEKRPTFTEAKNRFVNRYTMEYVPEWAKVPVRNSQGDVANGKFTGELRFYAPQYRTDREWYDNTVFPGDAEFLENCGDCQSSNASWPQGKWLREPYLVGDRAPAVVKPDPDALLAACESDDNLGFCLACGAEASGVEPDAENYKCESCGENRVFGAEQLLVMGYGDDQ